MKFEKFFKSAGTRGLIVKNGSETWLVCAGVGMKIPEGINNLGIATDPDAMFKTVVSVTPDEDYLELKKALIEDPEGKANDIIRVFETDLGDTIGISNANYGYLEKSDVLTYLEVEDDDPDTETEIAKYIIVSNHKAEVIGFINGRESY